MITNLTLKMLLTMRGLAGRLSDEDGQTLAEYSLIISAIAIATIVTGAIVFRDALSGAFTGASACLNQSC